MPEPSVPEPPWARARLAGSDDGGCFTTPSPHG